MSKGIILVGAPGCGKTYFTKHVLLKPVNKKALYLFDTNKEYKEFYDEPFKPNVDKFLARIYDVETDEFLMRDVVVLIEDATSFFSNRGRDETMQKIMVGRRHPNITMILLFHSMRDVPKYIISKCSDFFIFKTMDSEKYVRNEFDENIFLAWKGVQDKASKNKFYVSQPPPKNTVPSMTRFSLYGN